MSIRIELTAGLVSRLRTRLSGERNSDIISVINKAYAKNNSIDEIHDSVKNGSIYYTKRGTHETPHAAETSLVSMDDKLYLFTDRLLELESVLDSPTHKRIGSKYSIKDRDWD